MMMMENVFAGLAALPCPAIYIGAEPWLNAAMKKLVTYEEALRLFPENGEIGRHVLLEGRQFALVRSEQDERLLLLVEQFSPEKDRPEADALEMRLRNALACAMLSARLLSREALGEKGKSYLAEIRKNIAQIERACNNLRTAHLEDPGEARLTDMGVLVRELFDKANYYLPPEKQVGYEIAEGECDIYCTPTLVETMLLDLTVELLARGEKENRVTVGVTPGDHIAITFKAEHLGAFREELEKMLFEKEGEGTGFESARHAVTLHHGSLYMKKQGADGASLTVLLPHGSAIWQVYNPEGAYRGYDYVRTMLSDILDREAFMDQDK